MEEWGGGPNAVFGNFNVNKRNFSTPGGPTPSTQLQIRASKGVQWQIISVQGFIGNMRASGWGDNKATLNIFFKRVPLFYINIITKLLEFPST